MNRKTFLRTAAVLGFIWTVFEYIGGQPFDGLVTLSLALIVWEVSNDY
jgi:hypothetical protein